jgi:glutathione S-transferase
MSEVELYSVQACPFAQRTRMVLAEKAIEFEMHEIDLSNRPANWTDISPTGKVPVLRHKGETLYESAIINQYLDETFPAHPLMPATPAGRARARIWMDFCDSKFLPAMNALMWKSGDEKARAANSAKATAVIHEIEQRGLADNGEGPYWFGAEASLVDFQFLPFFERLPVYEELGEFARPTDTPRLNAWLAAMSARESVSPAMRPVKLHLAKQLELNARIAARRASAA